MKWSIRQGGIWPIATTPSLQLKIATIFFFIFQGVIPLSLNSLNSTARTTDL